MRKLESGDVAESPASPFDVPGLPPPAVVFGRSPAMRAVRKRIERVGATPVPVLIAGESGTGKDVLAHLIHAISPRRERPFVKVNCAAIPAMLMESELFGYEPGAFTGANRSKPGMVELAQGGTLFLDEIAELDLPLQAKLLHVLQDGTFSRIGGRETVHVEFRLVCATGRNLEHEIAAGRFRQDLYYRINVVTIELPPLRSRAADIPEMAEYFRDRYGREYGCPAPPVTPRLMELLLHHNWPGNIRELENLIRRYVILGSEQALIHDLLHMEKTTAAGVEDGLSLKAMTRQAVRDIERQLILDVLRANNWNRKEAARTLKISYRSLFYKLKAAGLPPKRERWQSRQIPELHEPAVTTGNN
jgi:two-component system response regulator AtoC